VHLLPGEAKPDLVSPAAVVRLESLDSWEPGPSPSLDAGTDGSAETARIAPFVTVGAGVGQDF
jgi:hypothetical protein